MFSDAMAYRGDLIACEVDFDHETNKTFPVVFFLNGREVARASMKRKSGQSPPFPFIAMGYEGIRVLVKVRYLALSYSRNSSLSEAVVLGHQPITFRGWVRPF